MTDDSVKVNYLAGQEPRFLEKSDYCINRTVGPVSSRLCKSLRGLYTFNF